MQEQKKVQVEDEKQPEKTENQEVEETTEEEVKENDENQNQTEDQEVEETTEEKEQKEQPVKRTVYTMPVAKAQKEKKRALQKQKEELESQHSQEIEKLNAQKIEDVEDEDLDIFAEEQGLESSVVKKIVEFAQKPMTKKLSKVDDFLAEKEKETEIVKVSQEFDNKVLNLIKQDYPTASPEHLAKVKKELSELAFTDEYHTYKLEDIYKVNKNQFVYKNDIGIEPSDGNNTEILDFQNMSDEQEHKLAQENPKKFAEFIKWQETQGSRYRDM